MNSNVSRPMPRANTGSRFLNWVSNTTMFLLQMERRIDPWIRPAFDATLRDPIARLVTALINKQRKDEGLKIAEEKPQRNEEEFLNSIISSFTTQMRGLWKPGGLNAAGTPRPKASCAASLSFTTIFRHSSDTVSMPNRKRSVAGCAFPGRVLTSRQTSTTWAS